MARQLSLIMVCVAALAGSAAGSVLSPDVLDSLLLPEASGAQAFVAATEMQGDELMDAALAKAQDPRFHMGSRARERLWQLMAIATDPSGDQQVWRQDQLDELAVALAMGASDTKVQVAQALRRVSPSLKPTAHLILAQKMREEEDAGAMSAVLTTLAEYRLELTQADRQFLVQVVTDLANANSVLAQNVASVDGRLTRTGVHAYSHRIAVGAVRALLQSSQTHDEAMQVVSNVSATNAGVVAEAMVRVACTPNSIFAHGSVVQRQEWISEAATLLTVDAARPFVRCCLRELAGGMYLSEEVPPSDITALIISAFQAHPDRPDVLQAVGELISVYDDASAVPSAWSN